MLIFMNLFISPQVLDILRRFLFRTRLHWSRNRVYFQVHLVTNLRGTMVKVGWVRGLKGRAFLCFADIGLQGNQREPHWQSSAAAHWPQTWKSPCPLSSGKQMLASPGMRCGSPNIWRSGGLSRWSKTWGHPKNFKCSTATFHVNKASGP